MNNFYDLIAKLMEMGFPVWTILLTPLGYKRFWKPDDILHHTLNLRINGTVYFIYYDRSGEAEQFDVFEWQAQSEKWHVLPSTNHYSEVVSWLETKKVGAT